MNQERISIPDYVASCDEDQLNNLVNMAKGRLKTIEESAFVRMWVICDEDINHGWFPIDKYEDALQFLHLTALGGHRPRAYDIRKTKEREDVANSLVNDTAKEYRAMINARTKDIKPILPEAVIDEVWNGMPGGPEGWLKEFGYLQFSREIEKAVAKHLFSASAEK